MKVTVDGITYEGTEDEIRRVVKNPPRRPPDQVTNRPNTDRLQPRDVFGVDVVRLQPEDLFWVWALPGPDPVPLNLCGKGSSNARN